MTFRALLDDGVIHRPALLVLSGQMTPRQVDCQYAGCTGFCPDCEQKLKETDLADGSSWAAAIAGKDRRVTYRKGAYSSDLVQVVRHMHFAHRRGYASSGPAPCRDAVSALHRETVEAIATQYRKDLPHCRVEAECQFVKPGTPPETYRPDIAVFNPFGGKMMCIEYQRSAESFAHFVKRHQIRGSEWGQVIWFFDRKIYNRSSTIEARDWLYGHRQPFYECWVDEVSLVLQVEHGTFGHSVIAPKVARKLVAHQPKPCSQADVIRELEAQFEQRLATAFRLPPESAPRSIHGFNLVSEANAYRQAEVALFERVRRDRAQQEEAQRQAAAQAASRLNHRLDPLPRPPVASPLPAPADTPLVEKVDPPPRPVIRAPRHVHPGSSITVDGQPGWQLPGLLPAGGGPKARVLVMDPAGRSQLVQRHRIGFDGKAPL